MKHPPLLNPLSISCIYAVLAGSWILFSDTILRALRLSADLTYRLSIVKGFGFVLLTACILYALVSKMVSQMKSAREAHEAELRESEKRFSAAFNSSPEPMAISELESGRYLEVNPAFLSVLGYQRSEIIGHALDLWADSKYRKDIVRRLLADEPIQGVSTFLKHKDGHLVELEVSADKFFLNGRYYLLGVGRDVSLHKRLERQLLDAQKMEALGRLAAGTAHDFKNLLMLIHGYAEMMDLTGARNASFRQQILIAVDRADDLTRQLLAYSRRQEVKLEVLDLNVVIADLSKMFPRIFARNIQASTALLPGLWPVVADRGQVEQVIMNLAVNAQDAMQGSGGSVVISTDNVKISQGWIGQDGSVMPPADYVEIAVTDSGCGIAPELLQKIFEPFFTTKEHGKGTGLGLAAVYGIVKQSNGFTLVESEVDKGTMFRILLPRSNRSKEMNAVTSSRHQLGQQLADNR